MHHLPSSYHNHTHTVAKRENNITHKPPTPRSVLTPSPSLLHCLSPSIPPSECTSVCVCVSNYRELGFVCVCVCMCNTHKGLACARLCEREREGSRIYETLASSASKRIPLNRAAVPTRAAHHSQTNLHHHLGVSVGVSFLIFGGRF